MLGYIFHWLLFVKLTLTLVFTFFQSVEIKSTAREAHPRGHPAKRAVLCDRNKRHTNTGWLCPVRLENARRKVTLLGL